MELNTYLRLQINNKIRPIYIKESCETCGITENLHLHHIKLFSEIVEETLRYMNLPRQELEQYNENDLDMISCIVLGKHLQISYMTLCEDCHKSLHKIEKAKLSANDIHRQYYVTMQQKKELERKMHIENTLLPYLESIINKRLYKEDQRDLITKIDLRVDRKLQRSYKKLNEGIEMIKLPYVIVKDLDRRRVLDDETINPNRDKTYWMVVRASRKQIP